MKNEMKVLFLSNVIASISYAMQTPLYPELANKMSITESMVGAVFSVYALANLLCIPFANQLISYYGKVTLMTKMTGLNVS